MATANDVIVTSPRADSRVHG